MSSKPTHITIGLRTERLFGWGVIIVLTLIPVVLWWRLQSTNPFGSPSLLLESGGLITGIVGVVLYSISLVLMTRLRLLENVFGGLNRVYIAHHIVGGLSLIFSLLHPLGLALSMALSSMKAAALLLLPHDLLPIAALFDQSNQSHVLVLQQWATTLGIVGLWLMVGLLIITIFIKLPYRIWLISHKLMGAVFLLIGLHIVYIQSDTSDDPWLKWYLVAWLIIGLLAFVYKTIMGQIIIRKYRFVINNVVDLGGGIVRLYLSPTKKVFNYRPGQFVFMRLLHVSGMSREWHPYSISSCQSAGEGLELSIKALGDYTAKLAMVEPGAIAELEGAYGKFTYTNYANRDQVWVAGGIGITPFLSMVKELPATGYRVYLFYSVKTRSEVIDWQLLYGTMLAKNNSLRVIPFIADEQPALMSVDYIEQVCGDITGRDFYLCGPPPMMSALKRQLKTRGISSTSIHSEEFSMS